MESERGVAAGSTLVFYYTRGPRFDPRQRRKIFTNGGVKLVSPVYDACA